ncbi:TPA: hypothetical protein DDW35_04920 [Candidatus Sumerlaeota bacterium]|nr:hypothetical protein [Candidatus Sumerlaeota bacterium]
MQQFLSSADNVFIGLLGAIFLFGFAVFVHELGHFLAAKWCGVGVKAFAIGFGPKIIAWKRGETEYSLRWIPLGGFVALKGMIEDEGLQEAEEAEETVATAGEPASAVDDVITTDDGELSAAPKKGGVTEDLDALRNQPAWARIMVFGAGVTMNFITAVIFCGLVMWYGLPKYADLPNELDNVPTTSTAYQLGWRSGDRIVYIQPSAISTLGDMQPAYDETKQVKPLRTWDDVEEARYLAVPRDKKPEELTSLTLNVTVDRAGKTLTLPLPFALFRKEANVFSPPYPAILGMIMPASPAHRARLVKENYVPGEKLQPFPLFSNMPACALEMDDKVLEVEDTPIKTWAQMVQMIRNSPDNVVQMTVQRGPEKKILRIMAVLEPNAQDPRLKQLAVMPGRERVEGRNNQPFFTAMSNAPLYTYGLTRTVIVETYKLFQRGNAQEIKRNLGGPAAIGIMAYKTAQRGLADYLQLFALISVILAVMNLLPIPVLDGGYIMITIIEAIIRRPIPQRILVPILTVFMFLFLSLFAFIFYSDFMNWGIGW